MEKNIKKATPPKAQELGEEALQDVSAGAPVTVQAIVGNPPSSSQKQNQRTYLNEEGNLMIETTWPSGIVQRGPAPKYVCY